MRNLKFIFMSLLLCMSNFAMAQNVTLNETQRKAQKVTMDYLRGRNYAPSIDPYDQSVCFKKGDILFWITFEGKYSPLLYTIHRASIKFADDTDKTLNVRREVAVRAANNVCASRKVKAFMDGGRVRFAFPMYAATPEDFTKVLERGLAAFDNIKSSFDKEYKAAKIVTDSIHNYWATTDTSVVVVPQEIRESLLRDRQLAISSISVRVVSGNGNVISDYDEGIRRRNCRFVQEKITLTAKNEGVFKVGVKIYTPDGKLLLPKEGAQFTTLTTIEVPKANKQAEYELLEFGVNKDDFWKAGEYRIEFYEDDTVIYTDAFNIL